jgi:uncharacterized RDD family membrane protein YckC
VHTGSAWRRLAAFGLDYLVIAAYMAALAIASVTITSQLAGIRSANPTEPWLFDLLAFMTLVLPVILYFALNEASHRQATWGKQRMGLVVISAAGDRLGTGRSLLRSALKFLPWQIAHSSLFHIPGWPAAVDVIPATATAGLWLSSTLAAASVASLFIFADQRTLYDRLAGTRVVLRRAP